MLRQLNMRGRSGPKSNPKYRKCVVYRKDKRIFCALGVLLLVAVFGIGLGAVLLTPQSSAAAEPEAAAPFITIGMDETKDPGKMAVVMQIFLLMTILSLAPAILIMLTSFTRIVIVLSLLRRALGTMQAPPNQVLNINQNALQPYLDDQIGQQQAFQNAAEPLRKFMFKQTREKDLALFVDIAKVERPQDVDDIPISVLIPSFIISEVKTAFQIGLMLYVPFLVIDMVVASVLLSMGMMMLPPIMISLPFKLMLFVLADGWNLLVGSLVRSFV
jgi:flagellar biosynthetic protein FliP